MAMAKHPTCEELGIDPDEMWEDFNYLEGHGRWPREDMVWPDKVLAAMGVEWLPAGMIGLTVWCLREHARIMEARLRDIMSVANETRCVLAGAAEQDGLSQFSTSGSAMGLTAALSRASKGMKVVP